LDITPLLTCGLLHLKRTILILDRTVFTSERTVLGLYRTVLGTKRTIVCEIGRFLSPPPIPQLDHFVTAVLTVIDTAFAACLHGEQPRIRNKCL
jgi:hypothetical protein